MSDPTIFDLYKVRETIEAAIVEVIGNVLELPCYSTQNGETREGDLWLEVEFDPGEATSHKHPCNDGVCRPSVWEGALVVRVKTKRGPTGDAAGDVAERVALIAAHRDACAAVATVLLPGQGLFTSGNLPYHQLIDCQPDGAPFEVDTEEAQDVIEQQFSTVCCIRPSAFGLALPLEADGSITCDTTATTFDDSTTTFDAA